MNEQTELSQLAKTIYASAMAIMVAIGLLVNVGSIIILSRKRHKSMFHTLLKILAVYDILVMLGCGMLYSLPNLSDSFAREVYLYALPWILPLVQIAMMTSIYCTILMSFERYIRICHLCQLKSSKILTDDNFWIYVAGFVVCPVLFYLPKFFEIRTVTGLMTFNQTIDCSSLVFPRGDQVLAVEPSSRNVSTRYSRLCKRFNFSIDDENEDFVRVILRQLPTLEIQATELRQNKVYYNAYCIAANTLFASLIPLLSLIYLNVCTVFALREMGKTMVDCQRTSTYRSVRFLPPPPPPTSINSGSRNEADALNSTASEGAAGLGRTKTETLVVLTRSLSTRVHRVLTLSRAKGEATLASMPDEEEEDEEDRVNASCGSEALDVEQVRRHRSRRPRRVSGIHQKLDYFDEMGFDSLWISPFYQYGKVDIGSDWINHTKVDSIFGNDHDLDQLLVELERRGIRVILDFIPNQTSKKMSWFVKSKQGQDPYTDFYVWRDALGVDPNTSLPIPPNQWESAVPGHSAWHFSTIRNQFYLFNSLDDSPDLNLDNQIVRDELKAVLRFWLDKPGVTGLRIGGFNLLFEDFAISNTVSSDVNKTITFFNELQSIAQEYSDVDKLERLWILEMRSGKHMEAWQDIYRHETFQQALIPFKFSELNWGKNLTGDELYNQIQLYISEVPHDTEEHEFTWACWEIGDEDLLTNINGKQGRIPPEYTKLVVLAAMTLPGTLIVYYGEEIGMTSDLEAISCDLAQDPFSKPPYCTCLDHPTSSRDPSRTPMQWSSDVNAGFSSNTTWTWLPVNPNFIEKNVEVEREKDNSIFHLFGQLLELRQTDALYTGRTYMPYHDREVFTLLRMVEDSYFGYFVILNLHNKDKVMSMAETAPNFPAEGIVAVVTSGDVHAEGDVVSLSNLQLSPFEGLVIELEF